MSWESHACTCFPLWESDGCLVWLRQKVSSDVWPWSHANAGTLSRSDVGLGSKHGVSNTLSVTFLPRYGNCHKLLGGSVIPTLAHSGHTCELVECVMFNACALGNTHMVKSRLALHAYVPFPDGSVRVTEGRVTCKLSGGCGRGSASSLTLQSQGIRCF